MASPRELRLWITIRVLTYLRKERVGPRYPSTAEMLLQLSMVTRVVSQPVHLLQSLPLRQQEAVNASKVRLSDLESQNSPRVPISTILIIIWWSNWLIQLESLLPTPRCTRPLTRLVLRLHSSPLLPLLRPMVPPMTTVLRTHVAPRREAQGQLPTQTGHASKSPSLVRTIKLSS